MTANADLTGLILAGGGSRRMGSDKATLRFNGRPLLQHARKMLQQCCAAKIHVVGRPEEPDGLPDEAPGSGPAHAIRSAAREIGEGRLLVIPVDMPLLEPADLLELTGPASAWRDHPLPCLLPAPAAAKAPDSARSMRALLDACGAIWLDPGPHRLERLVNINTPEDAARLGLESAP